ncbi:MAG: cold shock domain-containing protein [Bacteroidota bacterium]|nr:cold shock domain-containing protein [Bacteroidota bacterium]
MPRNSIKKGLIKGTVQWFDTLKGIGIIKTDEGNLIYVNYRDLPIKDGDFVVLKSNQKILFEIKNGHRGPQAKNIQFI